MAKEEKTSDYVSLDNTGSATIGTSGYVHVDNWNLNSGIGDATFTYCYPSRGVTCPYLDKCSDYDKCCDSCRHNTVKRSYYEPEDCPYCWDGTTTVASDTTWDYLLGYATT